MSDTPYVIFIMGPTATGKTDLAVYLHEKMDSEIISVDSAMVYRGLDIGTAKPDKSILEKAPHKLIDICDPIETYSAARFQQDAKEAIDEIFSRGKIPILVGGTGLYFRALEHGLAELPKANYRIRAQIEAEGNKQGWPALHKKLKKIDPDAAAKINENDPQRIQRALEVFEITGETFSALHAKGRQQVFPYPVRKIILSPEDRSVLHERVKIRFNQMLDDGLVEEVEILHKRGDLSLELPSMRLVGYRQVWRYLDGLTNLKEMTEHAIVATRQLAKRQITWCRGEENGNWYDPYKSGVYSEIFLNLEKYP